AGCPGDVNDATCQLPGPAVTVPPVRSPPCQMNNSHYTWSAGMRCDAGGGIDSQLRRPPCAHSPGRLMTHTSLPGGVTRRAVRAGRALTGEVESRGAGKGRITRFGGLEWSVGECISALEAGASGALARSNNKFPKEGFRVAEGSETLSHPALGQLAWAP